MYWIVTHSRVVYGDTVETSKAIFSRLYESYKLFYDNSKFCCIFNIIKEMFTIQKASKFSVSVILKDELSLKCFNTKLYNYLCNSFIKLD